jgi:hypothetical protein
MRCHV